MRRRGLGEVLHYFISEEEQAGARETLRSPGNPPARGPACWCLPITPERPLSAALAIDLAVAAARSSQESASWILASFSEEQLLLGSPEVRWRCVDLAEGPAGIAALEHALEQVGPGARSFVALRPEQIGQVLQGIGPGAIDGLLLPVEAAPGGPPQALALLRQLPVPVPALRIAAVMVGALGPDQARALFLRLRGAARRQLGLEIEDLGSLQRDPASFRALLRGISVFEVDQDADWARGLRSLCRRLIEITPPPGPAAVPGP